MLPRRIWLTSIFAATIAAIPYRRVPGQEGNSLNSASRLGDQNIANLEDQLKNGLRVVSPDQVQFVRIVVANVDAGKLPRAMVNLVYKWALERNPRVPFPYFQYALRALAKRRGVNLP
jgi:hypothetical protein